MKAFSIGKHGDANQRKRMRVSNQTGNDSQLPIQISNNVPPFVNFDQNKRDSEIREQSQSNGTRFNDEESGQVNQMRNTNFRIAAKYTDYFEKDSSINNNLNIFIWFLYWTNQWIYCLIE